MAGNKPLVLITGANGFIGRHLAPAMARERWSVRRAVRCPQGWEDELVTGSISAGTDWEAALDGVDAVVHLAARVHHRNEEHAVQRYRNVNLEGTLHLARCAVNAGVRHFIFLSTVLVHGRSNDGRAPFSESDTLTPHGLYGISKAAAERGLEKLARESDTRFSVIRPPLVYGAGAKGNFARLKRAVDIGMPLPFAAVANHRAFVAVQNLSSFIQWRLDHPSPTSNFEAFLLADQEQVSTPEFIERMAKAAGKQPRLFGVPPELLIKLLRMMGKRDIRDSLLGSLELNLSKALSTGWRPAVSLDEGLRLALSDEGSGELLRAAS